VEVRDRHPRRGPTQRSDATLEVPEVRTFSEQDWGGSDERHHQGQSRSRTLAGTGGVVFVTCEVVQVGGAAVGPVQDVVGSAVSRSAVAAADDPLVVPGAQAAPLSSGDDPALAAQVQPFQVGAEVDGADVGVSEQPEQFVRRNQAVPGGGQEGSAPARPARVPAVPRTVTWVRLPPCCGRSSPAQSAACRRILCRASQRNSCQSNAPLAVHLHRAETARPGGARR